MTRALSGDMVKAGNAQETDKVLICLLTFDHPTFDEPIRVCDEPLVDFGGEVYGVTSRGNDFIYVDFEVTLPDEDDELVQYLNLKLDNTDRAIIKALRTAAATGAPPTVLAEVVLHHAPDVVDITVTGLKLKSALYDAGFITAKFSTEHTDSQAYPYNRFTKSLFPGIYDGVG